MDMDSDMEELIKFYFILGLQQAEIVSCLALNHNVFISERHLRRKLRYLNLYRRKNYSDILTVVKFLEENLKYHGQLHGYKWMHLKCIKNNFTVTQENIRLLLHILDPEGVEIRSRRRLRRRQYRNKGPNYLWHMDCYDKLKPFGICISGCIDGFSRRIIWLKAGNNTNNPRVIAMYYMESVRALGGCPRSLRADMGTENGIVEEIQCILRNETTFGSIQNRIPAFLYGTSPANQRIEAWWSILRKHHSQFWLNVFNELRDDGQYSGSVIDKSLIQLCFMQIIQKELDMVAEEWNLHRIAGSRNSISPRGRPFIMFHMPQMYGTHDYLCEVNIEESSELFYTQRTDEPCDRDVFQLACIIMNEHGFDLTEDPSKAIDLYITLRSKMISLLN